MPFFDQTVGESVHIRNTPENKPFGRLLHYGARDNLATLPQCCGLVVQHVGIVDLAHGDFTAAAGGKQQYTQQGCGAELAKTDRRTTGRMEHGRSSERYRMIVRAE